MTKLRFLVFVAALVLASALAAVSAASPRSGNLHVTKECSQDTGARLCSLHDHVLEPQRDQDRLESRLRLSGRRSDPRRPRQRPRHRLDRVSNTAYGHVVLDPPTGHRRSHVLGRNRRGSRTSTLGRLWSHAPPCPNCSWDGPYSFSPPN